MATYYWRGGAGTWDATSTTNWSTTSGGAGGAGPPTSADNVIFNTLSNATAYAVTVGTNAVAADINISGPLSGNVTITGTSTSIINCYGSWTNAATGVAFSNPGGGAQVFLSATTTGKTITTNNIDTTVWAFVFNSASGGWTLGSNYLSSSSGINVNSGSFSTGNFAITTQNFVSQNTNVRSISLGSSTITLSNASPWSFATTTNLTFNAGTSTIVCSNGAPTFAGGGLTYNNVQFTSTNGLVTAITGNNTFNNLNQTSPSSGGRRQMSMGANQIVTGTFTPGAANLYNARVQVTSSGAGNPVTLTVATIATLSDVDFRDITAAGASGTWSGTRLGNGLGNTNITFAAGKTVYWNLVAGGNWSANAWATSSGGAVSTANFPLGQDTVIIDNTGLTAGNTITYDSVWWMATLNVTRTNAWTFALNTGPFIYGDATLTSATNITGVFNFNFLGQGLTQTLTTNGISFSGGISITAFGGTLLLNGAVTCASTATVTLSNGTLNLNNYTLTCGLFNSNNSNARTLAFGTGTISLTGSATTIWTTNTATNLTVTGTPVVNCTYSGSTGTRAITGSASLAEAYAITFNIAAASDTVVPANYLFKDLIIASGFTGTVTISATVLYGNLNLGGATSVGGNAIFFNSTSGTKTITSNGKTIDASVQFGGVGGTWQLQDDLTMGSTRTAILINGTLDLNNYTLTAGFFVSNYASARAITFGAGKIAVTGNNTLIFDLDGANNFSYTGSGNIEASYSGSVGIRYINIGNGAGGSQAVAMNLKVTAGTDTVVVYRHWNNVDFTGFAGTLGNNGAKTFYGNLTLSTGMTLGSGTVPLTFAATSGPKTVTSNGKTMDFPVIFDGIGGAWAFQDALTMGSTRALTLTNGTVQLAAGTTNTVGSFATSGTNLKYLQSTTPGVQATISDPSGTNTATYTVITDSAATGGATWTATSATNINGGNNTGWTFATPVAVPINGFFAFF